MITKKEFNEYNFFEQIEKFEEYTKGLKNISQDLIKEATKFFDLLKKQNLKKYKIDPNKSYIFINKNDFGLKIIHSDYLDREIVFNFDSYETSLVFHDGNDLYYDSIFGQGTENTCAYLLKNLENVKKITRQGKYIVEDVIVDDKNNIISTVDNLHIFDLFHFKKILNILPQKSTKTIKWK